MKEVEAGRHRKQEMRDKKRDEMKQRREEAKERELEEKRTKVIEYASTSVKYGLAQYIVHSDQEATLIVHTLFLGTCGLSC